MNADARAVLDALRRIPGEARLSEIGSYSKVRGLELAAVLGYLISEGLVYVARWRREAGPGTDSPLLAERFRLTAEGQAAAS